MLPMASTARSLHVVCTIPGLTDNADTHLHKTGCHKCVSLYTLFLRIHSAVTIVGVTTGLGSPQTFIFAVVLDHFEKTALRASPRTPLMKNTARVVFSCENKIMTLVSPVGFIAKEGEGEDLSSFFSHSPRCFACRAWRRCGGMLHAACVSSWSSCCTRCLKRLENFPTAFLNTVED